MATLYAGTEAAVRFDTASISGLLDGPVYDSSPTHMSVGNSGDGYRIFGGTGFTYSASGLFNGGTVTSLYVSNGTGGEPLGIVGMSMPVATLRSYVFTSNTAGFLAAVFAGNDTLNGHSYYAFDDYLRGYNGHDAINGGAGNDTLLGDAGNDTMNGQAGTDSLEGGAGNDNLRGGAANDFLIGGSGADTIAGGDGNDYYNVDNAGDIVTEGSGVSGGHDEVHSTITYTLSANVEDLYLAGATAATNGTGNDSANSIGGSNFANRLVGLGGNDSLGAGDGNDTLDGGAGADEMHGASGNDTYYADWLDLVDEGVGSGIDTVIASTDFSLNWAIGDVENLTLLAGAGNLSGQGNGLANKITGNEGENDLSGFAGNDTIDGAGATDSLNGGLGNDSLNGGLGNDHIDGSHGTNTINVVSGNDTVSHSAFVDSHDIIQGFDGAAAGGQDVLDFDSMFDSLGVSAVNRAGRVQLNDKGSTVDVRIDTNGDGVFEYLAATLNTANTITVGEDVVVGS